MREDILRPETKQLTQAHGELGFIHTQSPLFLGPPDVLLVHEELAFITRDYYATESPLSEESDDLQLTTQPLKAYRAAL